MEDEDDDFETEDLNTMIESAVGSANNNEEKIAKEMMTEMILKKVTSKNMQGIFGNAKFLRLCNIFRRG